MTERSISYESLDLKYRPNTFEEVKGQERCVRYLSSIVLRKARPRNVLLHGSVGSGKTSLARIYARAINCDSPTDGGSPCGGCGSCRMSSREHWVEYNVSGAGASAQQVKDWLEVWNRTPDTLRHRTLFLDEAHRLSTEGSDALLKAVEEPKDGIVFVFATTEIGSMRRALLSRLAQLEVMPLIPEEALEFLERVARNERMLYDRPALSLLAGLKDNYPRDLLIGLEQVYLGSNAPITVQRVKEEFDLVHTDALIHYLLTLGGSSTEKQMAAFLRWRESIESKVRWIQCILLQLYYSRILSSQIVIDPLVKAIDETAANSFLSNLQSRFGVETIRDHHRPFRCMIQFWATPLPITTDGVLLLRLAAFHELLNDLESTATYSDMPKSASIVAPTELREVDGFSGHTRPKIDRSGFCFDQENFFNASTARGIINAASLFTQQTGHLFNSRFELHASDFACSDERSWYNILSDFCDKLMSYNDDVALICVVERDASGLHAVVISYIPPSAPSVMPLDKNNELLSIEQWTRDWRKGDGAYPLIVFKSIGVNPEKHIAEHWKNVISLCAGIDPDERLDSDRPSLYKLLSLKKPVILPRALRGPLFFTSPNLSASHWESAKVDRIPFLSAFDDRAWEHLKSGWELKEFVDRRAEVSHRDELISSRKREFSSDPAKLAQSLSELRESWSTDPHDRSRSWIVWWMPRPV